MTDDFIIFETEHAYVEQCRACSLPGYLVLHCKQELTTFTDVPADVWSDVSHTLLHACRVSEAVAGPQRVYIARFGEEVGRIHFHIFPRTPKLLDEYHAATGQSISPANGPQLFEWARTAYRRERPTDPPNAELADAIRRLRAAAER